MARRSGEATGPGVRRTDWRDLELVDHWRRYPERPEAYLRHIAG
ncbi:AAA family ATPase [Kitasatospora sp. Ki12]|nr:hypothetical protein GCM10018790_13840 [Kitasatospora xanthocidica]